MINVDQNSDKDIWIIDRTPNRLIQFNCLKFKLDEINKTKFHLNLKQS